MELMLVSGVGRRAVARKFGVSADAVWRHGKGHISDEHRAQLLGGPLKLRELADKAADEGLSLLEHLEVLRSSAERRYFACAEAGDNQADTILGRITDLIRLQGQFTGDLQRATTQITNNVAILGSPLVADLKVMLIQRLRPFPDAWRAVREGLDELSARATQGATVQQTPALEHQP